MNRNFTNPYVIFYPTISRDGMPFSINKAIRAIQGRNFRESSAWRGNIVVAKYRESPFSSWVLCWMRVDRCSCSLKSLISLTMADFAILKNYLLTHGAPSVSSLCISYQTDPQYSFGHHHQSIISGGRPSMSQWYHCASQHRTSLHSNRSTSTALYSFIC